MPSLIQLTLDFRSAAEQQGLEGADATFGSFIGGLLQFVMVIAAILVLLYLVWGAIDWIVAGGDSSKVQQARDKITNAVIGLIVLSATVAIFILLQRFLGVNIFSFNTSSSPRQQRIRHIESPGSGSEDPDSGSGSLRDALEL